MRPAVTEYAPFYGTYIDLVSEADILPAMSEQLSEVLSFFRRVPEAQGDVCHPPYTWTVKDVIGHLTDGERVFGYRALRFARGDTTPLAGFDEGPYVKAAESARLTLADVVSEYEAARRSNLWLFRNLPEAAWARAGIASDNLVTVRALAYIVVGHTRHHTAILRKRLTAG
ncbi:DinB family protein [Frigoriglobus tundricola]|uniref:DinB-like domain-containing protein n=1 Tax=Frigoriglobus tundricola TaxID=2774151 RepID=A0A6M5YKI3_9BACT|nr:DinB family protein [Frigoriglobus tundricola]QJW94537.1 hypothetical protein FTUN_2058 [Frigoriglobus tundricola]